MRRLLLLAAVPPAALTLALLLLAAAELGGAHPLSPGPPRTLAEAAAMQDAAAALRFLHDGADVHEITMIREGVLQPHRVFATALEAAIMARDAGLVGLLMRHGGSVDGARGHLACLAADVGARDALRQLPAGERDGCRPGAALARVLDRP